MKTRNILFSLGTLLLVSCGPSTEQIKNDELFTLLKNEADKLDPFEGTAFVGDLQGTCYMTLKEGKKDGDRTEKIMRLRYEVVNRYQGTRQVVDETFTVSNLVRKKQTVDDINLIRKVDFANDFIDGKFQALKSSIDGGAIEDGSGTGRIFFAIDSINRKFSCYMFGTGNYSYEASIPLEPENHIAVKKIFTENISKEDENKILSAYEVLKITSDDLIDMGNNSYKVQLSKKKIIDNTFAHKSYSGKKLWTVKKIPLITEAKIENVSDYVYGQINLNDRFGNYDRTPEQEVLNYITEDYVINMNVFASSLSDYESDEDYKSLKVPFAPRDSFNFSFHLIINPRNITSGDNGIFESKCCDDKGSYIPHRLESVKPIELFEDKEFLEVFNKAIKLPMIQFSGYKEGSYDEEFFSTKIYLELVD